MSDIPYACANCGAQYYSDEAAVKCCIQLAVNGSGGGE